MNLKKNHYSRRALALLLTLVMCVGMIPTAFAAQQNSYHDPAEHWMQASGRTNELDANSVVTRETFKCGECGKATSFEVFRVPEYTRNGQPALSRNVKYSDGTMVDGVGKGDTMDGIPGKDATYTGYHYTKAVCETCGGINTNMSKSEYGYLKNVYWLYDCAAAFTQELDETVSYEYTDDTYHTVTTKGGTYCAFCYGTNHKTSEVRRRSHQSLLKGHNVVGRTAHDHAEFFEGDHGDVFVLLQGIQRPVVSAALQELVLRHIVALHGFPQRIVVENLHHRFPV